MKNRKVPITAQPNALEIPIKSFKREWKAKNTIKHCIQS